MNSDPVMNIFIGKKEYINPFMANCIFKWIQFLIIRNIFDIHVNFNLDTTYPSIFNYVVFSAYTLGTHGIRLEMFLEVAKLSPAVNSWQLCDGSSTNLVI